MSTAASLSALLKGSTIVDHKEVLEQCNQALKVSKSDPGLLHTKVVALLKLDRFAEAIQLFKDFPDQLDKRAAFERAYALYKLGHLKEAQVIASQSSTHRGLQHVQAQAVRCSISLVGGKVLMLRSHTVPSSSRMQLMRTRP